MHRPLLLLAVCLALPPSASQADPISDRAHAHDLVQASKWTEAANAFRSLVTANPYRGDDWYFLGRALYESGDCTDAAPALDRALKLGAAGSRGSLSRAHVEAAGCAAQAGDDGSALAHLSIARAKFGFSDFDRLKKDVRFARLADDPRFLTLAGSPPVAPVDRVAGWRSDLDAYVALVRARHPDPFHDTGEAAWTAEVRRLHDAIPRLDDVGVIGGFMRLSSMIGDGHTATYPPLQGARAFHLLPIWPYAMGKDWYVLAAAPGHDDLVGGRIVAVEGKPVAQVMAQAGDLLPHDNDETIRWVGNIALQMAELTRLAGGSTGNGPVRIEVEMADGTRRTADLESGPIDRDPTSRWAPPGWPAMGPSTPLWLARTNEPYWLSRIQRPDAVYAQVNQINDGQGGQTFEQFAASLGQALREGGTKRLILDLRHNNGGSGSLNWSLVREIVRSPTVDRDGGLYVIVGRRTFSAAMNLASMLETHTHAIFVGEPTGSRPNFYGEDTDFTLPWSGLNGSISSAWFQGGFSYDDKRTWIAPDLLAELTPQDVIAGRDPALEAIIAHIAVTSSQRTEPQ